MKYFILRYVGKPIGESGELCGTKYCFTSACPICGTNAQLEGRLHVRKLGNTRSDFLQTIDGDNLISEQLYILLISEGIGIGEIQKAIDHNGLELGYYHLYTSMFLPKAMKYDGLLIEDQCRSCKRNGYFNDAVIGDLESKTQTRIKPVKLYYRKEDVAVLEKTDIISSWEHMGLSNMTNEGNLVARYARPMLIVSDRLVTVLTKMKIDNIRYEAVNIE